MYQHFPYFFDKNILMKRCLQTYHLYLASRPWYGRHWSTFFLKRNYRKKFSFQHLVSQCSQSQVIIILNQIISSEVYLYNLFLFYFFLYFVSFKTFLILKQKIANKKIIYRKRNNHQFKAFNMNK